MAKASKWYVGVVQGRREAFRSVHMPTAAEYGDRYSYAIGPFRTKRGARFMEENPHCQCVADAERLAKAKEELL